MRSPVTGKWKWYPEDGRKQRLQLMLEHNGRGKLDAQAAGAERGGGGGLEGEMEGQSVDNG